MNDLEIIKQEHYSAAVVKYNDEITEICKSVVHKIIDIGKKLIDANENLSKREYNDLIYISPLSESSATQYRLIAERFIDTPEEKLLALPNDRNIAYVLSQIENPERDALIENGTIHSDMNRAEAEAIKNEITGRKSNALKKLAVISLVNTELSVEAANELECVLSSFASKYSDCIKIKCSDIVADLNLSEMIEQAQYDVKEYQNALSANDRKIVSAVESAIYYLRKPDRKKHEIDGSNKLQAVLPEDHIVYKLLSEILNDNVITIDRLKKYCKQNNIQTRYTTLKHFNESVYISQQICLFEDDNKTAAMKNLNNLVSTTDDYAVRDRASEVIKKLSCYV